MNPYEARRQARIERLQAAADRKRAEAETLHQQNATMADAMNGTPILRGHHSERRHVRDIERMDARRRKAVALTTEAAQLERRAAATERNDTVNSDDPEALVKLREKLVLLKEQAAKLASWRKALKGPNAERQLLALGVPALTADDIMRCGIPSYIGTNLSGNIRRTKARIAELEKAAARGLVEPARIGAGVVEEAGNRVRIRFDGKPSADVREQLKSHGFRWAPSEGVWQRKPTVQARYWAEQILRAQGTTTE